MAVSKVFSLLMSAMLLGFSLAQSPSGAPSPSPVAKTLAPSPLAEPPIHASPSPAPTMFTTPPPTSSSPSPSPAGFFSPPSPPPSTSSPSPSVSVSPTAGDAPLPSANGAVFNGAGLAAAALGFFAVILVA